MIRVFTRYICFELFKIFIITLSAMTILLLLVVVVQEAVRENLTPWTIIQLIPFLLPNALCFAIPATMLFATCMVLGRMASANEIVAIKSIGISPLAAIWPVVVMGFVLSLITVILNDFAVSWGRQGVYRVVLRSVEKTIYSVLSSQNTYQNGKVSIVVDDVVGTQLIRPVVQIYSGGLSGSDLHFTAERAGLSVDVDRDVLVFSVVNMQLKDSQETVSAVWPDGNIEIPLQDVIKKGDRSSSPSNLPLRAMRRETQKQNQQIETQRKQLAMKASFQMLGGDFVSLTHPRWHGQLEELDNLQDRAYRLLAEPWRRWANGFSCFCFVCVGAPLAILLRKQDFWNTFALCFIPILVVYYPLLMFGVGQAKSGDFPPPAVWLGNLAMLTIGWLLIRKVTRH